MAATARKMSPAARALLEGSKSSAPQSGEWRKVTLADVDVSSAPLADRDMVAGAVEVAALMVGERLSAALVALATQAGVKLPASAGKGVAIPLDKVSLTRQTTGKVTCNLPVPVSLADGQTFHVNLGASLPSGPISDLLRPFAGLPRPKRD